MSTGILLPRSWLAVPPCPIAAGGVRKGWLWLVAPASLPLFVFFLTWWQSGTGSKRERPCGFAPPSLQTFSKHEGSRSPMVGAREGASEEGWVVTQHLLSEVRVTVEKTRPFYCSNLYLNIESITCFSTEFKIAGFFSCLAISPSKFWGIKYSCINLWRWQRGSLEGKSSQNSQGQHVE